jgi:hypothetical protein
MNRKQRADLQQRLDEIAAETRDIKQLLQRDEREEFVCVVFPGNSSRYTYEVDEPCKVGDYCIVHSPRSGRDEFVQVVALGRGSWRFGVTKLARRYGPASSPPPVAGVAPNTRLIADGTYRVTCAHIEQRRSEHTGRHYWMATHVVLTGPHMGEVLHQPLMDHGPATWIWEDAGVQHPKDLPARQLFADVRQEEYNDIPRMKVGKLLPIEVERDDNDEDPFRGSDC